MKILIVGGTGLTGAHAALYLRDRGHDVTILSRSRPSENSPVYDFAHIAGNYIEDNISTDELGNFDAMVFCAGVDIRGLPEGVSPDQYYHEANTVAIPRFFRRAKQAGISRAVLIGSYYPQVVPDKIETDSYVRSRHLSCEGALSLNDDTFNVCALNAPFIVGSVPGLQVEHLAALALFGAGKLDGVPMVAPGGGVNVISSQSMSEAIAAALDHGTGGKAYLVGDENLSWKQYLEMFCEAAGNPVDLPVSTDEHPLFPDVILFAGRNAVVHYDVDTENLEYCRNNIKETVNEVVRQALSP